MKITVEALAKIIHNIPLWDCYETPHAQAEALLPYIERHIAAGQSVGDAGAWVHEDDPTRVISAKTKAGALADAGASGSSVRPYSVPLHRLATPKPAGEVPLPHSWVPDEIDGDEKVCSLKSAIAYGDAREAAWRADAVPAFRERVSEIEDAIAAGKVDVYQCFTQMRQLIVNPANSPEAEVSGFMAIRAEAEYFKRIGLSSQPIEVRQDAMMHSLCAALAPQPKDAP